jgi:hypothetical protein
MAFKNLLFLNPVDFNYFFQLNGDRQPVYVKCNKMILRLHADDRIAVGEVAPNSLQKESLRLSKIDPISLELVRVSPQPIGLIECTVDLIFRDKNMAIEIGKATQLNEEEIMTEIRNLFANKQINQREIFAIYVMEKLMVLKVTIDRIEAIDA